MTESVAAARRLARDFRAERGPYRLYSFETKSAALVAEMCALIDESWRADYKDRATIRFDEHYVDWLLPPGDFFGVAVFDDSDRMVACEVALARTLRVGSTELRSFYVTLLTVSSKARGAGLAQWVLHHLYEETFERRGAQILCSMFDEKAGGQGTVERSIRGSTARSLSLVLSEPIHVWAAVPDLRKINAYEPITGLSSVAVWPGLRDVLQYRPRPRDRDLRGSDASIDAVAWPTDPAAIAFVPARSLTAMYAAPATPTAGVLRYRMDRGEECAIAYHLSALTRPGLPPGPTVNLQLVLAPGRSNAEIARALRAANSEFFSRGCISSLLLDTGMVCKPALIRAGFLPAPRSVRFALRGPTALVSRLPPLKKPMWIDLL